MIRLFFVLILLIVAGNGLAQTYEEWLKREKESRVKFAVGEKQKLQELQREYDAYVKKRDEEFAEYLKQRWEEFEIFAGRKRAEEPPKPNRVPVCKPGTSVAGGKLSASPEKPAWKDMDVRRPFVRVKKSEPKQPKVRSVASWEFYGNPVMMNFDERLKRETTEKLNESFFSDYWLKTSAMNYDPLLDQLFDYKYRLGLNDWGYYLLIKSFAEQCVKGGNSRVLLTWFLLNKSGYIAGLGHDEGQAVVLLPTIQAIYARSYIMRDGMRYYIMGNLKRLYTYTKNLEGSDRLMDLRFERALNFSNKQVKERTVVYGDRRMTFKYNDQIMKFYDQYPATDMEVYFNTPFSAMVKECVVDNLYPLVNGVSQRKQINTLLSFLHKGFAYKTDDEQFGREKYFFPDELLGYPYSDCEDRAVFFVATVKLLTGMSCVGLNYPGHASSGVEIDSVQQGDYVELGGRRYWECDPTYIGASLGMSQPGMRGKTAKIIPIEEREISKKREDEIVSLVERGNGCVMNRQEGISSDGSGKTFVVGTFGNDFCLNDFRIKSIDGQKHSQVFLACLKENDRLDWVLTLEGNGITPYRMHVDDGCIVLLGMVSDKIVFSGLVNGKPLHNNPISFGKEKELFVLNVSKAGKVNWISRVSSPEEDDDTGFNYALKFGEKGNVLQSQFTPLIDGSEIESIRVNRQREWLVNGRYSVWTSIVGQNSQERMRAMTEVSVQEQLKMLNDDLLKKNVDRGAAGLLAVASFIIEGEKSIAGKDVLAALDRYNPSFKKSCPNIYKNIGRISLLRSDDGIMYLSTTDGKPVNFDKMQLKNGCRLRLSTLANGNVLMNVVDGISVGKAFIWFPLNSVQLYRETGDMVFDYDDDHTLRTFNLRKDILNN